jgi:hypothetical protein
MPGGFVYSQGAQMSGTDEVAQLKSEVAQLKLELEGERKANALWAKGMESQCELMDSMKQELRALRKENAALKQRPPGPEGGGS